ncbi:hypothetical protein H6P81_016948 [Aristolochia fimbriata]|uniref:Uncharacterized protein n=1 Tax=Aristolochia fimbriata TaxID=158543 RepID=A0AAV7DX65_ARIFI|nr:hypothetical protein H6P81_016948 [Aristolochia fimbriata]
MATVAVKTGNPGASLTKEKKEMAEKTGQPLCSILNEDNKEKTVEEGGHYSGLLEVLKFDEQLLNDMKSGIVPFVEESPSITIYQVPESIGRVDEKAYTTRYRSLAIHFPFSWETSFGLERELEKQLLHITKLLGSRSPVQQLTPCACSFTCSDEVIVTVHMKPGSGCLYFQFENTAEGGRSYGRKGRSGRRREGVHMWLRVTRWGP